ncbi:hypothetical protein J4456_03295 [Candidatus Pacearchaeota archaeon]|nr:hypothetical protein [Candidatus Pacearchaeota archaeon]
MILERTTLTMSEVEGILKDLPESEKKEQTETFLKKFLSIKPAQAAKMKEELEKLDLIKMSPENIIKIIDLLPEDMSDLNKIFVDVSLTEDEAKKVLDIIKNSK